MESSIFLYTLGKLDWQELLFVGPCPGQPRELMANHHLTLAFAWRSSDEGANVGARFDSELENYPYIGNNDKNDQVWVLLKMALHGS